MYGTLIRIDVGFSKKGHLHWQEGGSRRYDKMKGVDLNEAYLSWGGPIGPIRYLDQN
jgi:hypothetical protein